ncbi:three-Cys-motif partner protein TcmP [Pedobacter agri]|uniref:three-Cys-motif partner protein TcmP n=1 Tax=Pedobacter agri TaxID=454586 RepID=UPI00293097D6|nr:three-Cys-motif partner protein TcmP [Pedobacter agri]
MPKKNVKNIVLPHSQAKLDLYRDYLNEYLPVLMNTPYVSHINVYDVFCGAGVYTDGKYGSPLIAAECINANIEVAEKRGDSATTSISLTVNDLDAGKVEFVGQKLTELSENRFKTTPLNMTATKMFELVKDETSRFTNRHRSLVFVDPYGYSDITKENLFGLLQTRKTEVILFLPVSNLYRFTDAAQTNIDDKSFEPLRRFLYEFFSEDSRMMTSEVKNIYDYINEVRKAFSFDGSFYSSAYYIKRDRTNHYALFFIGPHIYGLEKFLQAKWKNDSLGQGFDVRYSAPSLFGGGLDEVDIYNTKSKLESCIKEKISNSPYISNVELYEYILVMQFLPNHAKSIFDNLVSTGLLEIYDDKLVLQGKVRGYYLTYGNYSKKSNILKFKLRTKNGTI